MRFDWKPESKDRYFRKAEAAVKAAGFDDILQISREQFAITKSTVKVYFKPIPREGKTRRWWEAKKSIAGMQEQSGGRDEFGRKKKTIFIFRCIICINRTRFVPAFRKHCKSYQLSVQHSVARIVGIILCGNYGLGYRCLC